MHVLSARRHAAEHQLTREEIASAGAAGMFAPGDRAWVPGGDSATWACFVHETVLKARGKDAFLVRGFHYGDGQPFFGLLRYINAASATFTGTPLSSLPASEAAGGQGRAALIEYRAVDLIALPPQAVPHVDAEFFEVETDGAPAWWQPGGLVSPLGGRADWENGHASVQGRFEPEEFMALIAEIGAVCASPAAARIREFDGDVRADGAVDFAPGRPAVPRLRS